MLPFEFENQQVTMESLTRQHTVIAMEAVGLSQMFNAGLAKLPSFLGNFRSFLTHTMNPFAPEYVTLNDSKLRRRLDESDYVTLSPLRVVVPEGFKGYWLDYLALMTESAKPLVSMQSSLLKPFEMWIAAALNAPDSLKSLAAPHSLNGFKAPDIDRLSKLHAGFFSGSQSTSTYGKVFKRNADVPVLTRDLNELTARFAAIPRKEIIKQVESIVDLLSQLLENAKADPETYRISGPNLKLIADMTYYVAREVEYYAIYGYQLNDFSRAVNDSYKALEKALDA